MQRHEAECVGCLSAKEELWQVQISEGESEKGHRGVEVSVVWCLVHLC